MRKTRLWMLAAILTFCGTSVFPSCSSEDNTAERSGQEYTGVPLVILDTDLGSSTDDLFALEMLHRYEQEDFFSLIRSNAFKNRISVMQRVS